MSGNERGIRKRRAAARANANERYLKRREVVIEAAAKMFKENGFAATSIDDIARETGFDRASVYYYAGNKEELFQEVVLEVIRKNVQLAKKIRDSSDSPVEKIAELFEGLLQSYTDSYPHMHVFIQEDPGKFRSHDGADKLISMQRDFDSALIAIIQEGVDSGMFRDDLPVRLVAFGLIGMINWSHRWFHPGRNLSAKDLAQTFSKIAVDGLRCRTE